MGLGYQNISIDAKGINPLKDFATLMQYRRIYRELKPSLILQYTIKPNIYGSLAAKKLRIPVVNNITGLGTVFEKPGLMQELVKGLYRTAFSRVNRVFFQNKDDMALFLESNLIRKEQADLLPGSGVDPERFKPIPRPEGPFCFMFIGRLLKSKGVEDFVQAARRLKPSFPEVRFVLVGPYNSNDPYSADINLLKSAAEEKIIELPGPTDNIQLAIAQADCCVLPSKYREGTPRSLLEAASMAKPLIAADSVGTREPVMDGINGFLCRPADWQDLAQKMELMLQLSSDEIDKMGTASREMIIDKYDEQIVINKYLQTADIVLKE